MTGGLLNIVSYGNQNVILNGNPKKTFFKATYAKYTNFGLQKFRIDFTGQRSLRLTTDSTFTFYVPRYADLLMDTYIALYGRRILYVELKTGHHMSFAGLRI